jgi:hypothetical protein
MNNLYCHRPTPLTTYSLADLIGEPAVQYDEADYMRGPARLEAARQAEAFESFFSRNAAAVGAGAASADRAEG